MMALKSYEELRKIDVRPFCKKRDGIEYLNWAKCIDLLRENGAEKVYWEPIPNKETGSSLIMSSATFTDGKGNYWSKVSRGLSTALNESLSSLEKLSDEASDIFSESQKFIINEAYRTVSSLFR